MRVRHANGTTATILSQRLQWTRVFFLTGTGQLLRMQTTVQRDRITDWYDPTTGDEPSVETTTIPGPKRLQVRVPCQNSERHRHRFPQGTGEHQTFARFGDTVFPPGKVPTVRGDGFVQQVETTGPQKPGNTFHNAFTQIEITVTK